MNKQGRNRTLSICLSDIPKERILVHENGKKYLSLSTYDTEEPDKYGNDFSVSITRTKEETEAKANRIFIGNGRIWPDKEMRPMQPGEEDDLPF